MLRPTFKEEKKAEVLGIKPSDRRDCETHSEETPLFETSATQPAPKKNRDSNIFEVREKGVRVQDISQGAGSVVVNKKKVSVSLFLF